MFQTSYFNKSYSEFKSALESYDKNFREDLFVKAIEVAENSHKDQFRASGDPYIIHPYLSLIHISEPTRQAESRMPSSA